MRPYRRRRDAGCHDEVQAFLRMRLRYSFQVSANEEKFFAGLRTEAPPSRH
jgi:hypothetical protein